MQTETPSVHRPALKAALRPSWKEKLAKECVERVRRSRANLLWQQRTSGNGLRTYASREALGSILAEEMQKVAGDPSESKAPSIEAVSEERKSNLEKGGRDESDMLWEFEPSDMSREPSQNLSDSDYEDLMLEMERALHEEMQEEAQQHEMAIVMEYEKAEAALRDSIEAHERMMLEGGTPAVLCPLCQRGRLFQGNNSIFCINGDFRIDTQHDHINLEYLQRRLEEVCQEHSKICMQVPGFVIQERFDIKALYLACQGCGTFQIVI